MYGLTWPFLLLYGSHDMRDTGFRRLTVVNRPPPPPPPPGFWGFTNCMRMVLVWSPPELSKSLVSSIDVDEEKGI